MTTIPHEAPVVRRQIPAFWVRDMWPSLTIVAMWLAVLFDAIYGRASSLRRRRRPRRSRRRWCWVFAFFATWVVAKYGFRRDAPDN